MKFLFVTGIFPSTDHGGGIRVFDLICELIKQGNSVSLFSSNVTYVENEHSDYLLDKCTLSSIVPSDLFNKTALEAWILDNHLLYDVGYYIWPWTSNMIVCDKTLIKKNSIRIH